MLLLVVRVDVGRGQRLGGILVEMQRRHGCLLSYGRSLTHKHSSQPIDRQELVTIPKPKFQQQVSSGVQLVEKLLQENHGHRNIGKNSFV